MRALMLNFPRSSFGIQQSHANGSQRRQRRLPMNENDGMSELYAVCLSATPCHAFKFPVFVCIRNYLWYEISFGVVKVVYVSVCAMLPVLQPFHLHRTYACEWMSAVWKIIILLKRETKKKCVRNAASSRFDCCTNYMLDASETSCTVVEFIFPCAHTFRSHVIIHRCFVFHPPQLSVSLRPILLGYRLDWLPISSTCCCRHRRCQLSKPFN